jgi:hypothetical protein
VVTWISWGLVVVGIALLTGAVMAMPGRLRPMRRALRRLSWRAEELTRLQDRADALRTRAGELTAEAIEVRRGEVGPPRGGDTA